MSEPSSKGATSGQNRPVPFKHDPSVREDWTNQGRVLRRLGEPNACRAYGSHRPAAVLQSALRGGSSQSHDLLHAFRVAYRSDNPVRPATFETLRFPSVLSGLRPKHATKIVQIQKGPRWPTRARRPISYIRPIDQSSSRRHAGDFNFSTPFFFNLSSITRSRGSRRSEREAVHPVPSICCTVETATARGVAAAQYSVSSPLVAMTI